MFQFLPEFPPKTARVLGPQQNPKAALLRPRSAAPLVIHPAKPGKIPQKLFAESGLQPGEILMLRCPASSLVLLASLPAQNAPGLLAIT